MLRNKVVWDKHYKSNRLTVRNIFLLRYSRFRLMCTFKGFRHRTESDLSLFLLHHAIIPCLFYDLKVTDFQLCISIVQQ